MNFLATSINLIEKVKDKNLNWIGNIIKFIIERPFWAVGVGIIIFTILLKFITLPFDILSRVASKKNSLKMEKMRPELQRLQKQYANNKQLYQQKVMALQKKSGYSPFSACLPSIIAIIIFIVVINAFSDYSTYANRKLFNKMINSYNQTLIEDQNVYELDGKYYLDTSSTDYTEYLQQNYSYYSADGNYYTTTDTEKLIEDLKKTGLIYNYTAEGQTKYLQFKQDSTEYEVIGETQAEKDQKIKEMSTAFITEKVPQIFIEENVLYNAQLAAKHTFNKEVNDFLWIKNIWVSDSMFKNPLEGKSSYGMGDRKEEFKTITALMESENNAKNGYFILVILSVGVMVLSQVINRKEQKTQMELQSVEGKNSTASQTQKVMMVIMPLMYGIFAFIYTSAFSIYMITSSLFSVLSSLLINLIVTKVFNKKIIKEQQEKQNSRFKFKR